MRFDTGPLDRLFGKRVTLRIPGPDGTTREVSVTENWLAQQKQQGTMSQLQDDDIPVHVADPFKGCYETTWKIGRDIAADTVDRRRDPKTGRLYAIVVYKDGSPEMFLCDQATWAEAKQKLRG